MGLIHRDGLASDSKELQEGLVKLLIDVRQRARKQKDWATADYIRDELARLGVNLEDSPLGTRWKR